MCANEVGYAAVSGGGQVDAGFGVFFGWWWGGGTACSKVCAGARVRGRVHALHAVRGTRGVRLPSVADL